MAIVESEDVYMLLKYIVVIVTCKHCKQVSQKLRSNVHAVGDALICSIVQ